MKRFEVGVTHTITVESTVTVRAKDEAAAMDRVTDLLEKGADGIAEVKFLRPRLAFKEAEITSIESIGQADDATEIEDD